MDGKLMDGATGAVGIVALAKLAAPAATALADLVNPLLGPASAEVGAVLADAVKAFRYRNLLRLDAKVRAAFIKQGVSERALPKSFLFPLLEAACDVDDDHLQELWARLLSAAAQSDEAALATYIETIRRLTPLDARVLSLWYARELQKQWEPNAWRGALAHLGSVQKIEESVERLRAGGLVQATHSILPWEGPGPFTSRAHYGRGSMPGIDSSVAAVRNALPNAQIVESGVILTAYARRLLDRLEGEPASSGEFAA